MAMKLFSSAFEDGGPIPSRYTCEGSDESPPLAWNGVPPNARSLVLIVDDPDAPDPTAPKMVWDHWILYNLPGIDGELPTAVQPSALPPGTCEGLNSWGRTGYGGPCPPTGRHRYFHIVYALDRVLEGVVRPEKNELLLAMEGHIIEQANLVGTYEKAG